VENRGACILLHRGGPLLLEDYSEYNSEAWVTTMISS